MANTEDPRYWGQFACQRPADRYADEAQSYRLALQRIHEYAGDHVGLSWDWVRGFTEDVLKGHMGFRATLAYDASKIEGAENAGKTPPEPRKPSTEADIEALLARIARLEFDSAGQRDEQARLREDVNGLAFRLGRLDMTVAEYNLRKGSKKAGKTPKAPREPIATSDKHACAVCGGVTYGDGWHYCTGPQATTSSAWGTTFRWCERCDATYSIHERLVHDCPFSDGSVSEPS